MKKFYIVGVTFEFEGFFAIVNSILDHMIYAYNNGYVPLVDMMHYNNQYFKDGRIYKDNVWEYFFEQPGGLALENIPINSEVIISKNVQFPDNSITIFNEDIPINNLASDVVMKKKEIYKKLLKFNGEIQKYLDTNTSKILRGDDVLGILCRGTDYTKRRSYGEHIQPNIKDVIKKTKEVLKKYPDIKKIYLATEDEEIYNYFKAEFGNVLLENIQYKYKYNSIEKQLLSDISVNRADHNYNLAKEYLLSIYILSRCKYFIGGRTTGTKWAWIMADNWIYTHVWDLGLYGKTFKEKLYSVTTERKNDKSYKIYQICGLKFKKGLVAPFHKK